MGDWCEVLDGWAWNGAGGLLWVLVGEGSYKGRDVFRRWNTPGDERTVRLSWRLGSAFMYGIPQYTIRMQEMIV